jgi:hypothetical protein
MKCCPSSCYLVSVSNILLNKLLSDTIKVAGFEVLKALVIKYSIIWDTTPFRASEVNWCFEGIYHLRLQGKIGQARIQRDESSKIVWYLAYFSTMKMEATCSFETSVDFQQAAWRYIPEERTLHSQRCLPADQRSSNKTQQKTAMRFIVEFHKLTCFLWVGRSWFSCGMGWTVSTIGLVSTEALLLAIAE